MSLKVEEQLLRNGHSIWEMFSESVNVNVAVNDSSNGLDGIIDKSSFHSVN